jgi:hypothetical protein
LPLDDIGFIWSFHMRLRCSVTVGRRTLDSLNQDRSWPSVQRRNRSLV